MKLTTFPRHFLGFLAILALLLRLEPARGDDSDDLLVPDAYMCQGDMSTIGQCLERQNEKVDRWHRAVIEGYARAVTTYMADLRQGGSEPFDQVAQLDRSEALFEQYRDAATELAYRTGLPGSGNKLEGARAYFQLTVAHTRFLLRSCSDPRRDKLADAVDLTLADWCSAH